MNTSQHSTVMLVKISAALYS